ncbi:unnamed protein product [Rhizophagus irregularis]|nr:unnamed protein product [Rhizophagus irregularis]
MVFQQLDVQLFIIFDGSLYVQINHNFNTKSRRLALWLFGRVEFGVSFSLWSLDIAGFLSAWESGRSDDQFFEYLNT